MSPRTRVGAGQELIHEIIESVPVVHHLEIPNVFSQVATPEYFNLDPAQYGDVTPPMIAAAAPAKLRVSLIDVHRNSQSFIVGYQPEQGNKERYVPLYPREYRLISRTHSPARYGEVVLAGVLSGKKSLMPSLERQHTEGETDKIAAIEKKRHELQDHLDTHLRPNAQMFDRLIEAAQHPGLRRRKEVDTRIAVTTVRDFILPQVLQVIGRDRKWSDEQHVLAQKAIDYRLFFMREGNQHLKNWVEMLKLLRDYEEEKINLFADRAGRFSGYLIQHGVQIEETS